MGKKPYWDDRREKFSQSLALGVGTEEAGAAVGYSAANSRRNAQRDDVKKRVAELRAPALAKLQDGIDAMIAEADAHFRKVCDKSLESEASISDGLNARDKWCKLHNLYRDEDPKDKQPTVIKFQLNIFGADQRARVIEHESLNGSGNH